MFEVLARFLVLAAQESPAHASCHEVVSARCVWIDEVGARLTCLGGVGSLAKWGSVED